MTLQVSLYDDKTSSIAKVNTNGGLIVAPSYYSTAFYIQVDAAATPFEIIPAEVGLNFIITGLLLASSKTFGSATTAETLTLYEANAADLTTNLKTIAQIDMLKNDRLVATSMDLATSKAVTIVASATDTAVDITISGYYINV